MTIIALLGKAQSGKSTFAEHLVQKYNFTEYALASPIKRIASIFGFTHAELYGADKNKVNLKMGISAREFMQKFGTEIARDQFSTIFPNMNLGSYNSIWIRMMMDFIRENPDAHIVISDVRFTDEFQALSDLGAKVTFIEIVRDLHHKYDHSSENSLQAVADFTIHNNGTMENFTQEIDTLISKLV